MAYDEDNGIDYDPSMKQPVNEISDMTMEALLNELSSLDSGIQELTKRRTIILRELNQRQKYHMETVQHSHEWYYNLTRSDEAMPDNMTTENIRRY